MSGEVPHKAYVVAPPDSPRPEHPLPSPGIQTPGAASGLYAIASDLNRRLQEPGPTVTITKAQAAWLMELVRRNDVAPPDAPSLRAAVQALFDEEDAADYNAVRWNEAFDALRAALDAAPEQPADWKETGHTYGLTPPATGGLDEHPATAFHEDHLWVASDDCAVCGTTPDCHPATLADGEGEEG